MMASIVSTNITSPLGLTTEDTYRAMSAGMSGLAHYPCEEGGTGWRGLPFAIEASLFSGQQWATMMTEGCSRFESIVLYSVKDAVSRVALNKERTILILSSTKGDIERLEHDDDIPSIADTAKKISQATGIDNAPIVVCNACISGASALMLGQRLVDSGEYESAVVCGADVQGRFIVSGFHSLQALSAAPCRPFDIDRHGLNLGEAAATVVLTSEPSRPDGWKITQGYVTNDAYHISAPHPKGIHASLALSKALKYPDETPLALIGVHGTATMYNDQMESMAVESAGLTAVPLSALKGYFGHTLGAAGVLETIITARALDDGIILPSKGYQTRGVSGRVKLSDTLIETSGRCFVKMLSGFGGCNAALRVSAGNPEVFMNDARYTQSHCVRITRNEVVVDSRILHLKTTGREMLTEVYKHHVVDYPRFYKMDMLSRLAFIAAELLVGVEGDARDHSTDRAVVLFNHSSSIIADRRYYESIRSKDAFFPSPAAFVHTLPNISTGEIALRHGYHGETSFYILHERNDELMHGILKTSFADSAIESVMGGWIDCPSEDDFECEIKIFNR